MKENQNKSPNIDPEAQKLLEEAQAKVPLESFPKETGF